MNATPAPFFRPGAPLVLFLIEFSADGRVCRVVDEHGRKLLAVAIGAELTPERRDQLAALAGQIMAVAQDRPVRIAPFPRDEDPS